MLEKWSRMSARDAMIGLAGRPPMHGELPRWLESVAKSVGISFRTARAIWNGEISNPDHLAIKELKRLAVVESARREAALLAQRFETIAGGLNAKDPDFHSADVSALVHAARILRGLDRTGD
jgi:hypothetical protein